MENRLSQLSSNGRVFGESASFYGIGCAGLAASGDWGAALLTRGLIFVFGGFLARGGKVSILTWGLGAGLSFYGVLRYPDIL